MKLQRRQFLGMSLWGAGGLGLRALATGLPAGFLAGRGREALAQAQTRPTALILCISRAGDPINVGAPGSVVAGVDPTPGEALLPTQVVLGDTRVMAARPWSTLDADLRDRLAFFHHQNGTAAHTELESLLRLHGGMKGKNGNGAEMLPSAFASEAHGARGTLQEEPLALGNERLTFEDRPLDNISPSELKSLFSGARSEMDNLRTLRNQALDQIYAQVKSGGSAAQKRYLDRFALGQQQAAALGVQLGALLERLPTSADDVDGALDQLITAVAVVALQITSVVAVQVPFGGDNHDDQDLAREAEETQSGVAALGLLWSELKAANLQDQVTYANLNTFGRTLSANGGRGRDHNGQHHVTVMFGPKVKPGVIGALVPGARDFAASPLDTAGRGRPDGPISGTDTLLAVAKTLGAAMGLSEERLNARIPSGQVITGALT